jgi:hypothetical protein
VRTRTKNAGKPLVSARQRPPQFPLRPYTPWQNQPNVRNAWADGWVMSVPFSYSTLGPRTPREFVTKIEVRLKLERMVRDWGLRSTGDRKDPHAPPSIAHARRGAIDVSTKSLSESERHALAFLWSLEQPWIIAQVEEVYRPLEAGSGPLQVNTIYYRGDSVQSIEPRRMTGEHIHLQPNYRR